MIFRTEIEVIAQPFQVLSLFKWINLSLSHSVDKYFRDVKRDFFHKIYRSPNPEEGKDMQLELRAFFLKVK